MRLMKILFLIFLALFMIGGTAIVGTQLAQTLDAGRLDGRLSRSVIGAVGGTTALLALAITMPPLQRFFGLPAPSLRALTLIVGAAGGAVGLGRTLAP